MKAEHRKRLVELEAKLDLSLFGVRRDPVTGQFVDSAGNIVEPTTADKIKAGVAATAIGAGGTLVAKGALARRYGANHVADPAKARQAMVRGIQRDASTAGTAIATGAQDALTAVRSRVGDAKRRVGSSLRATAGRQDLSPAARLWKASRAGLRGLTRFEMRKKVLELAAK